MKDFTPTSYTLECVATGREFPDEGTLAEEMRRAGFHEVSYRAMTGGIVFLHAGVKAL